MKKSLFLVAIVCASALAAEPTPPAKPAPPKSPAAVNNAPVTRAEFTALTRRVAALEAATKKSTAPATPLVRKPPGAPK